MSTYYNRREYNRREYNRREYDLREYDLYGQLCFTGIEKYLSESTQN